MKRILLFSIITSLIFIGLSNSVLATSGACSWHGGVNCDVGPDWDGSVICNDGWKDSTVSFYSTDECFSVDVYCTPSELESLWQKYGVPEKLAERDSLEQEVSNIQAQLDKTEDYTAEKLSLISRLSGLAYEMQAINYQLELINDQVDEECWALGYDRLQERYDKIQQRKLEEHIKSLEELEALSCPANSSYLNGECVCDEGYIASGDSCITYNQRCQNQYGIHSYGDKEYCYCERGYEWNSSKTACIKSITCPANSTKIAGECVCNDGYGWDSSGRVCIKKVEEKISLVEEEQYSQEKEEVEEEKTPQLKEQEEQREELESKEQKPEQKQKKSLLASVSAFVASFLDSIKEFFYRIFH